MMPVKTSNNAISEGSGRGLLAKIAEFGGKYVPKSFDLFEYLRIKQVDRNLARINRGDLVADIGGGWGLDDILFASNGARPVVVDIRDRDLRIGKRIAADLGLSEKIQYIRADARNLPFRGEVFDVVVSYSSIEHLVDREEYRIWVSEMARVTRNDGIVAITTSNRFWMMYPIAKLMITLKIIPQEHFFTFQELEIELKANDVSVLKFDAGRIYFGHSPIPVSLVNKGLGNLLNKFEDINCFKILCARMGFEGQVDRSNKRNIREASHAPA